MICFRDKSFCGSDCTKSDCPRHFGDDDWQLAKAWWARFDAPDREPPIHYMDFAKTCPDYRPARQKEVA